MEKKKLKNAMWISYWGVPTLVIVFVVTYWILGIENYLNPSVQMVGGKEELKYLTTNDSERIELLTTVARENEKLASSIVAIIEKHISACRADCKLWGLYLLDSVTKSRK